MSGDLPFSADELYRWASDASIERGWDYYERGAVASLVRRGDELVASVWGSDVEPYRVRVRLDARGAPVEATCICPYDWGGWCKHIVAALLAYLHEPEKVAAQPPLQDQLAALSAEELRALVTHLASTLPAAVDLIDAWLAQHGPASGSSIDASQRPPLEADQFYRQARSILHSLDHMRPSEAYWHVGQVIDRLEALANKARDFLAAGDVTTAINVLKGVTRAYVRDAFHLDDSDGYVGEFAHRLGELWVSVLLAADLDDATREELGKAFSTWQATLEDYGLDEALDAAWEALNVRSEQDVLDFGDPALIQAYLERLERQGDDEAYLRFALEAGEYGRFAIKLVRLGRAEEALDFIRTHALDVRELEALVQALREEGHPEKALDLGARVLAQEEVDHVWALWLADQAEAAGDQELALQAVVAAFRQIPSLALYRRAQRLAGDAWPRLREELLDFLRAMPHFGVDIFLEEQLWDDALRAVERGYMDYETLRRVVDAVLPHRPEAAARIAQRQAERIMDAGESQYYHRAVDWLRRLQKAYQLMGKEAAWAAYLEDLITKHYRKYKLRPMLEALRK